jgi:hypothetical protein
MFRFSTGLAVLGLSIALGAPADAQWMGGGWGTGFGDQPLTAAGFGGAVGFGYGPYGGYSPYGYPAGVGAYGYNPYAGLYATQPMTVNAMDPLIQSIQKSTSRRHRRTWKESW